MLSFVNRMPTMYDIIVGITGTPTFQQTSLSSLGMTPEDRRVALMLFKEFFYYYVQIHLLKAQPRDLVPQPARREQRTKGTRGRPRSGNAASEYDSPGAVEIELHSPGVKLPHGYRRLTEDRYAQEARKQAFSTQYIETTQVRTPAKFEPAGQHGSNKTDFNRFNKDKRPVEATTQAEGWPSGLLMSLRSATGQQNAEKRHLNEESAKVQQKDSGSASRKSAVRYTPASDKLDLDESLVLLNAAANYAIFFELKTIAALENGDALNDANCTDTVIKLQTHLDMLEVRDLLPTWFICRHLDNPHEPWKVAGNSAEVQEGVLELIKSVVPVSELFNSDQDAVLDGNPSTGLKFENSILHSQHQGSEQRQAPNQPGSAPARASHPFPGHPSWRPTAGQYADGHMGHPVGHMGHAGGHMGHPVGHMGHPGGHMGPPGSHMGGPMGLYGGHMGPPGGFMGPPGVHMSPPGRHMSPLGGFDTAPFQGHSNHFQRTPLPHWAHANLTSLNMQRGAQFSPIQHPFAASNTENASFTWQSTSPGATMYHGAPPSYHALPAPERQFVVPPHMKDPVLQLQCSNHIPLDSKFFQETLQNQKAVLSVCYDLIRLRVGDNSCTPGFFALLDALVDAIEVPVPTLSKYPRSSTHMEGPVGNTSFLDVNSPSIDSGEADVMFRSTSDDEWEAVHSDLPELCRFSRFLLLRDEKTSEGPPKIRAPVEEAKEKEQEDEKLPRGLTFSERNNAWKLVERDKSGALTLQQFSVAEYGEHDAKNLAIRSCLISKLKRRLEKGSVVHNGSSRTYEVVVYDESNHSKVLKAYSRRRHGDEAKSKARRYRKRILSKIMQDKMREIRTKYPLLEAVEQSQHSSTTSSSSSS